VKGPAWAAAAVLVAACAGGFVRPDEGALQIGETTPAQALERLGPPTTQQKFERNGQPLTLLAYLYTTEAEKNHGDRGVIASRALYLFFHDDRLVGHEFRSTVASDHTDFDLRKVREIVKGETTRDGVTRLLGRPSGSLRFPMINANLGEALVYGYSQERRVPFGKPIAYSKSLIITFDQHGAVSGTFYDTSGTP
jgi:hypothetical protein